MKHTGTITIETPRLILRKFTLNDAQQMFDNYCSHEAVTEFLTWRPHKTIDDTLEFLNGFVLPAYEQENTYRWVIILKETNQVIGSIDVVRANDAKRRAELGWVLGDEYWGKGYMPEAGKAVTKLLFKNGYERVEALHDVRNPKSGRVMQKIGMKHEGVLKHFEPNKDDILVDCDIWAITDENDINL